MSVLMYDWLVSGNLRYSSKDNPSMDRPDFGCIIIIFFFPLVEEGAISNDFIFIFWMVVSLVLAAICVNVSI